MGQNLLQIISKIFSLVCYTYIPSVKRGILGFLLTMQLNQRDIEFMVSKLRRLMCIDLMNRLCGIGNRKSLDSIAHGSTSKIDEVDDDSLILKTKSLSKIYEKCNMAMTNPSSFEEVAKLQV
ncbi:hypothetical protein SLE2022_019980 [Rubroshorea leprosula]